MRIIYRNDVCAAPSKLISMHLGVRGGMMTCRFPVMLYRSVRRAVYLQWRSKIISKLRLSVRLWFLIVLISGISSSRRQLLDSSWVAWSHDFYRSIVSS